MGILGHDFYAPARNEIRLSEISVHPTPDSPLNQNYLFFLIGDREINCSRSSRSPDSINDRFECCDPVQLAATFPIFCSMLHITKFNGVNEP